MGNQIEFSCAYGASLNQLYSLCVMYTFLTFIFDGKY